VTLPVVRLTAVTVQPAVMFAFAPVVRTEPTPPAATASAVATPEPSPEIPDSGAAIEAEPAAVMSPLPLTVKVGIEEPLPKEPVLLFTVASVVARAPAVDVMSPVSAGCALAGSVPEIVEVPKFTVKPAPVAPPVSVPTTVMSVPTSLAAAIEPASIVLVIEPPGRVTVPVALSVVNAPVLAVVAPIADESMVLAVIVLLARAVSAVLSCVSVMTPVRPTTEVTGPPEIEAAEAAAAAAEVEALLAEVEALLACVVAVVAEPAAAVADAAAAVAEAPAPDAAVADAAALVAEVEALLA